MSDHVDRRVSVWEVFHTRHVEPNPVCPWCGWEALCESDSDAD